MEDLYYFTNLGIRTQFSNLGKCSFLLENHWNIYFVLPTLVYCNNLPMLGNVVIHWKINGIAFFFTNYGILEQFSNIGKCRYSLVNHWNIPFILTILIH